MKVLKELMGINLRDFIDPDEVSFKDLKIFWELLYEELIEGGAKIESEMDYINELTEEGKREYAKVKEYNPDWEFPLFLNK